VIDFQEVFVFEADATSLAIMEIHNFYTLVST